MTKNEIIEQYEKWSFKANEDIIIKDEIQKLNRDLNNSDEYMVFHRWDKQDKDIVFNSKLVLDKSIDSMADYEEFIILKY
ncbi:MAG: hypothetical protein M1576_04165 [Deltaproteobacteria bacterium]|nr:hypothetical protein [Deltaproteobacteria bacterium]